MPFIKFTKIWEDDDSMLQIEMVASNGKLMTTQDFYIYPEDFNSFARDLEEFFPKLGKGEVVLEYGSEVEKYYAYVLCKITYKNLGEVNIEFRTSNNHQYKDEKVALSHFFSNITNQELNDLGKRLVSWLKNMDKAFIYEWKST